MRPEEIVRLIIERHKYAGNDGAVRLTARGVQDAASDIVKALMPALAHDVLERHQRVRDEIDQGVRPKRGHLNL